MNYSSLFYRNYIGEEADAAVVCIDKSRPKLYMAMVFACWMNVPEVRDAVTWQMWYGDKESYWLAAELMGVPYSFEAWSSARMAQSQADGVPVAAPASSEELEAAEEQQKEKKPPRTRRGAWENLTSDDHIRSKNSTPPADRRCTTHMVHSSAAGHERCGRTAGSGWISETEVLAWLTGRIGTSGAPFTKLSATMKQNK